MKDALEEISRQLARISGSGSFVTHLTATTDGLNLEVQDLGRIRFPITVKAARRLCEVARQASHGFKDETRVDLKVRDTWEISSAKIQIDELRWMKALTPQLEQIRRNLGLPEGCLLKAQLHNLLVYAPGQFFVPHQDSEKAAGMIGTLVVSLPSQFSGGAIAIEHHDQKIVVASSKKDLTLIAFYADCHHEVRPVTQGYRIVLTYNLVTEGAPIGAGAPCASIEILAQSVRKFFETSPPQRWASDHTRTPPDRLVYLLDHEYTQHGLAWPRLKNADAQRAGALQEVARNLDCEIFLALADVHETWSCEEEYAEYGRYGRHDDDNEDADDEYGNDLPDLGLTDLLDSDVELRHWVGADGQPEAVAAGVDSDELCYTKPSSDFEPFESEHEGYTGNAGNTVEHWYHRAAVVLWPRERTFIIRSKASPLWGINEIANRLKAGDAAQGAALLRQVLPFWPKVAARADQHRLLNASLKVAAKLNDRAVAATLLQPFALTRLTPRMTSLLANLLDSYGLEWCRTLLRDWESGRVHESPEVRLSWIESALPALCRSLRTRDRADGPGLAKWLLSNQWSWLLGHLNQLQKWVSTKHGTTQLARLSKPILSLMESTRITCQSDLHAQVIQFLTRGAGGVAVNVPLGLLQTAHEIHMSDALRDLGLKPIHIHCRQYLKTHLDAPMRANDDWSIMTSVSCSCTLCATFGRYLHAREEVRFEWPLAKTARAHIHGIVGSHDLPVTHITRRTGRPFTLILEKTRAVFERDAAERRFWQNSMHWLTKTIADF